MNSRSGRDSPRIHGSGSIPATSIGTPPCSTITLRSRSSCTGASPQLSGTTPRENGSRVEPVSWLPSDAYMPSGGSSRAS